MAEERINITLVAASRELDLRVPTWISVQQLITEVLEIYPELALRCKRYQLRISSKGLLLTEGDIIANYPVSTGDVVEIVEGGPGGR